MTRIFSIRMALFFGLAGLMACQPPTTSAPDPIGRNTGVISDVLSSPPRDLSQDEAAELFRKVYSVAHQSVS